MIQVISKLFQVAFQITEINEHPALFTILHKLITLYFYYYTPPVAMYISAFSLISSQKMRRVKALFSF